MAFVLNKLITSTLQRYLITSTKINSYVVKSAKYLKFSTAPPVNDTKNIETSPVNEQQLLLSDTCKKRLKEICGNDLFLRITVEGGGCSGFQYKFDLDAELKEDDLQFGEEKAKVVIDNISIEYCAGATLDYHTELIRSGFRIISNPKAEQGCSCGSSFAIKLD